MTLRVIVPGPACSNFKIKIEFNKPSFPAASPATRAIITPKTFEIRVFNLNIRGTFTPFK